MAGDTYFLIKKLLSRPIAFHRVFADVAKGGATEALFLSQAYYWSQRTTNAEGWFYKSQEEWTKETALTRREQESARKKLKQVGILEEKAEGLPRKLFFRVQEHILIEALTQTVGSNPCGCQSVTSDIQACQKRQTSMEEMTGLHVISDMQSIYTETTSKITSEKKEALTQNNETLLSLIQDPESNPRVEEPETLPLIQDPGLPKILPSDQNQPTGILKNTPTLEDQNVAARREVGSTSDNYNASARCDRMLQRKVLPPYRISDREFHPDFIEYWQEELAKSYEWRHNRQETPRRGDAMRSLARIDKTNPEEIQGAWEAFLERNQKKEAPLATATLIAEESKPVRRVFARGQFR